MDNNPAQVQPRSFWLARTVASLVCVGSLCLILVFLVILWLLFGSNMDFPPTWYWAVTVLLTILDLAAICYLIFKAIKVLVAGTAPSRVLRSAVVVLFSLFAIHIATVYAYSNIPQWDFQDGLFDDLSRPGPGTISQNCPSTTNQSASKGTTQSVSIEQLQRIARIQDWSTRYNELQNRTAAGWRGWVYDAMGHDYYSNPDHYLVRLFLHDPYSTTDATKFSQWPEAEVSYYDLVDARKLTVGQEVLVCGDVNIPYPATSDADLHIRISRPVLNVLPLPEAYTTTQVPVDFLLEYEEHGCGGGYPCPDYSLRIDASGNVTYTGNSDVRQVPGTQTARISQDRLRQLVYEIQRTNLLAITDLPEKVEGVVDGAIVIRVRMNGRSKTVAIPRPGGQEPDRVTMLIGKIVEVSDLRQWVKIY